MNFPYEILEFTTKTFVLLFLHTMSFHAMKLYEAQKSTKKNFHFFFMASDSLVRFIVLHLFIARKLWKTFIFFLFFFFYLLSYFFTSFQAQKIFSQSISECIYISDNLQQACLSSLGSFQVSTIITSYERRMRRVFCNEEWKWKVKLPREKVKLFSMNIKCHSTIKQSEICFST